MVSDRAMKKAQKVMKNQLNNHVAREQAYPGPPLYSLPISIETSGHEVNAQPICNSVANNIRDS